MTNQLSVLNFVKLTKVLITSVCDVAYEIVSSNGQTPLYMKSNYLIENLNFNISKILNLYFMLII